MEFTHKPIMLDECIENLNIKNGSLVFDCTLGLGGHSEAILKKISPNGRLIGIDRDEMAIKFATERLAKVSGCFTTVHDVFFNIKEIAQRENALDADGILADLGVSSYQLDDKTRGFSYMEDYDLDMRMDKSQVKSAKDIINSYSEQELTKIIRDYGEERWANRIAKFIVEYRKKSGSINTTGELTQIIKAAIPAAARREGPHPAKRTFQAIRIEVNDELGPLKEALFSMMDVLKPGGRLNVITFHSLEDRIVKQAFKTMQDPCICDKKAPICTCGRKPIGELVFKKPITPSDAELEENPRARSAKLRVIEKL